MKTYAEHLPIELWILIFRYIEIHDLFRAFTNLNNYFNRILASNHLLFYIQLRKDDIFYKEQTIFPSWSTTILNRIISLKLSTKKHRKYIFQFLNLHGKELIRLKSLTIEIYEREICPSCIDFLKYHSIEYLSLKCIPNQVLIEAILSSPKLCKCRLYFW
ncbi:unnamed protein product [Rotaria sordida]|uniref:F-box domain-containing protein n=1 Tax=Rotaria sordida TaxID=392033 RepID=A0A813SCJ7_9BILA|nr:unnamed protein product [Rotaria sordida]CAF1119638.1 unnamed protein product [Rotaria sordida]